MNYDALIEKLMAYFTGDRFRGELEEAKREFFDWAGAFDEYSTDFEMKMSQFVDWFLFTRPLSSKGAAPITVALELKEFQANEEERQAYESLSKSNHSLFEFLKVKDQDVYVKDIIAKEKHVISKSPVTAGFDKAEYFEARLIPAEGGVLFGRAFCFHPADVSKYIAKEAKTVQKIKDENAKRQAKEALITRLFKMRYKHEKYRHVNVKEIYTNDSKLRI